MKATLDLPVALDSVVIDRAGALWQHAGLSLGLRRMDAQHAWLVALVLELEWTLTHDAEAVPERFLLIAAEARKYALEHFAAEERLFQQFHFSEDDKHIRAHRKFGEVLNQMTEGSVIASREDAMRLYRYLRKWLIQHILIEDRKYSDYLKRRKLLDEANQYLDSSEFKHGSEDAARIALLEMVSKSAGAVDVSTPVVLKEIASIWNRLKLQLGVPIIDIQHLWLIKMLVDMDEAMRESALTREAVLHQTISEATRYIDVHFRTEEALMALIGYEDEPAHRGRHKSFETFVQNRRAEFDAGNYRAAMTLVNDLREWLVNHIALEDRKLLAYCLQKKDEVMAFSKEEILSGRANIAERQVNLYKAIVLTK